ncbi:MAG: hypothetical protein U7M05_02610 [Candidatus Igneacidithiobacillus chanchocoensis]
MIDSSLIFSSVKHCRDTVPQRHDATWAQFADRLQHPVVRLQKDGVALIFAVFDTPSRKDEAVTACTALAFDIEQGHEPGSPLPLDPESLHNRLRDMRVAHVIWTTFSHVPEAPRYRLVVPVSEPFAPAYLPDLLGLVADRLGIAEIIDRKCTNPARLMFAPAVHPDRTEDYLAFSYLHVSALDVGDLVAEVLDLREQRQQEQQDRLQELRERQAARLARRASGEQRQDVLRLIQQFNVGTTIEAELEQAGYQRRGKRWVAPTSHSGIPGVSILTKTAAGKAWSFHEGDPLADGRPHDAWDVRVAYQFNGDRKAAVRALLEGRL